MNVVSVDFDIWNNTHNEHRLSEQEHDDHIAEHREGLGRGVSCEAEGEHVCER